MTALPMPVRSPLLEVSGVTVTFPDRRRGLVTALDDVTLGVAPGETLGLVGESGSGKSTLGRAILGLVPVRQGSVSFDGEDITHATRRRRRLLSRDLQVIFQDPYSSLNPQKQIGTTLLEPLRVHQQLSRDEASNVVGEMLTLVGLQPGAARRYPNEFSGGQRQRIAIARALIASPRFVICDEPVSAVDLSIQAQVLNLLAELQARLGLSYLFIAHDLAVVHYMCQRIIVLYRGRIMEQGTAEDVYRTPAHPYTQALLRSAPSPDPRVQRKRRRPDATPVDPLLSGSANGEGCPFVHRCPHAIGICATDVPPLFAGRVACHRYLDPAVRDSR